MDSPLVKETKVLLSSGHQPSVFVPKAFPAKGEREPMWIFKAYEIRYLDAIHRGISHEKAATQAGLSVERAEKILKGKKAKNYLSDLLRQKTAAEGMSQEWFLSELKKVWYGEKIVSKQQMDAMSEIGDRIAPKPEKAGSGSNNAPQITINIGSAEAAIKRQKVIEAEIVNGPAGSTGNIPASV